MVRGENYRFFVLLGVNNEYIILIFFEVYSGKNIFLYCYKFCFRNVSFVYIEI